MNKKNIVLASESPRRKELLKRMGLKFKVVPAKIKENLGRRFQAKALKKIAFQKAAVVSGKIEKGLIIAADTIVVVKGVIYGKPETIKKARVMLKTLSGTTQNVWTAVAIIDKYSGKKEIKTCVSRIRMKNLAKNEIEYLAAKNLDKAGGYGIQEDDKYLKVLKGSRTNIVGLPTELLSGMLARFGVKSKPIVRYKF
ncbi:MAG: septum formation protein Maf [Candidatus Firestonebacteria bacterium RIFOXYC2_FULL_39_67]|nr:MAG: septum formation protein Maf [Candidatus Firestonebacteria bacterium RIFOXYD2_FULL_39_29]OGF54307.1 MAG: septum formation protein Maf [Candidatus Firestonebacteria bacterium RIFOXYC2_FULL_39_67]OGF57878.1 MAG: septum formation protein Maf [Candidatus Firestonebacteria bacterium RifOxyC12_full_39_7]